MVIICVCRPGIILPRAKVGAKFGNNSYFLYRGNMSSEKIPLARNSNCYGL